MELSGEKGLRITRYHRDLMGNIVRITNPLGDEEEFSYDLLGRIISKTDRDGYETRYEYTALGELSRILYADGRTVCKKEIFLR